MHAKEDDYYKSNTKFCIRVVMFSESMNWARNLAVRYHGKIAYVIGDVYFLTAQKYVEFKDYIIKKTS